MHKVSPRKVSKTTYSNGKLNMLKKECKVECNDSIKKVIR